MHSFFLRHGDLKLENVLISHVNIGINLGLSKNQRFWLHLQLPAQGKFLHPTKEQTVGQSSLFQPKHDERKRYLPWWWYLVNRRYHILTVLFCSSFQSQRHRRPFQDSKPINEPDLQRQRIHKNSHFINAGKEQIKTCNYRVNLKIFHLIVHMILV